MSSEFGINIKYSIFGQSHGNAIGVLVDRFPVGEHIDFDELQNFLARRKPGQSDLTTKRNEADEPIILSGLNEKNITCGAPFCAIIKNNDVRSQDYSNIINTPRPGHADYTAWLKYEGHADIRGGGHFSGRLTAPLCVAGGIALQILKRREIFISAKLIEAGGKKDEAMFQAIRDAAADGDSVGGVIECLIFYPKEFSGLGEPMFDGVESQLAKVLFGIPAVKGVEFGAGFEASRLRGSQNNDEFKIDEAGNIFTSTNNAGGILGGITNGMPIVFRAAFKPTPSISISQKTVNLSEKKETEISIKGRHDPCLALRAIPVVEAAAACVMLDLIS
ncbi:MAG: chorismate synthase [Synergistaceae bacterium]|nr:chorismate synthase [Synergistaceae bacterium]